MQLSLFNRNARPQMLSKSYLFFVALAASVFFSGAANVPLTPGNLLVTYIFSDSFINTGVYAASIGEFKPDGTLVQSWALPNCLLNSYIDFQGKIIFDQDYSVASVLCKQLGGAGNLDIHMLNTSGELSMVTIDGTNKLSPRAAFVLVNGNDVWIGGSETGPTSPLSVMYYTTLDNLATTTKIEAGNPTPFTGLQIFDNEFYLGLNTNSGNGGVSKTTKFPKTGQFINFGDFSSVVGDPSQLMSQPNDFYVYGLNDIYICGKDTGGPGPISKAYNDGSQWLYYGTNPESAAYGCTAGDVNGVRKVFAVTNLIYSYDDTMTSLDNAEVIFNPAGKYAFYDIQFIQPPPSCNDTKKNQDETDVDCGGTCGATCANSKKCLTNGDCLNDYCNGNNVCATPTCADSFKNQNETDVDCGGVCGATCADTKSCKVDEDCLNGYCDGNDQCATPTCSDSALNQDETDVDCGGICGATCADTKSCSVNGDCLNGYCDGNDQCATPTCSDGAQNQDETDVDCGGTCGATCANTKSCSSNDDCLHDYCKASQCLTPTCSDYVKNQNETDIDCGGVCGATCKVEQTCIDATDCITNACTNNVCVATCFDGLMNQDETDVDCGGQICNACPVGSKCLVNADCDTNLCTSNECVEPVPVSPPVTDPPQSTPQSSAPQSETPQSSAPQSSSPNATPKSRVLTSSAAQTVGSVLITLAVAVVAA